MRYLHFLAVLTSLALGTELASAQQWTYLPPVSNSDAPQHGTRNLPAEVTAPTRLPDQTISDSVVPVSYSSCITEPASCGDYCQRSRLSRVFFSLEYLYWQATNDATAYTGTLSRPSGTINGLPISSSASLISTLQDTSYEHNGGFRVNLGYQMSDCWNIGFRYTYFDTSGNSSVGDATVDSNAFLANRLDRSLADDILDTSFDDGETDFASQRTSLDFNTYDIELRRQFRFNSKRLVVGILGGIRFSQIDQASQIRYQNLESGNLLTADTDETMDMHATGLRVGGETHYLLGWNTSIFARGSVALMYANFDVSRRDIQTSATAAGIRSISDNFENVVPVTELNIGVRWQRGRFYVAGGYDIATWFDMAQGMDAINQDDVDGTTNSYRIERGNLSFDGFFAEAGMQF